MCVISGEFPLPTNDSSAAAIRIQVDPCIIPNLTLETRAILELPASFFSSSFKPSITNPTHNVSCRFGDLPFAKQLH
jgi:hypothetical protein